MGFQSLAQYRLGLLNLSTVFVIRSLTYVLIIASVLVRGCFVPCCDCLVVIAVLLLCHRPHSPYHFLSHRDPDKMPQYSLTTDRFDGINSTGRTLSHV